MKKEINNYMDNYMIYSSPFCNWTGREFHKTREISYEIFCICWNVEGINTINKLLKKQN